MKNIRGTLFLLPLSIVLLFNSITVTQAKEYMCVTKRTTSFNWYLTHTTKLTTTCDFKIDSQKDRRKFDLLKSIWMKSKGNLSMGEIHKSDLEKILVEQEQEEIKGKKNIVKLTAFKKIDSDYVHAFLTDFDYYDNWKNDSTYLEVLPKFYNQFIKKHHPKGLCYRKGNGKPKFFRIVSNCESISEDWAKLKFDGSNFYYISEETQVAKKEPKKVVEPEQEEIKVKTKKKDTTGPEIEIAEAITVDDSSYTLKGKVSDKGSDKIYIKVDGQDIAVKKGKFKIKRYSPVDEEIKIVAIDKFGNKSTKMVKVTIDIKEETVVKKLEPLNPGRAKGKISGTKVALIIGIENYKAAPKANYANLDAKYFFDYAQKAFGVKKQNINLMINEEATYVETNVALTKWLRTRIKPDQTDLIIFFAGHGLASSDGKELYLLPQDSDPDLLSRTALSRTELFAEIISLKPKTVTMFLDTCYSGVSRDEQMLLASARPIRIVAGDEGEIPNNFTIFSASQLDQISSGFKEAKHGIFSYYLMKGLEGKADANKNKEITNGELLAYMDINVSQKALEQGRSQSPSLSGDPDQVLMRY